MKYYTDTEKQEIITYAKEHSFRKAAQKFKCSVSSINFWMGNKVADHKKYYQQNKEKRDAQKNKWREKNKDKVTAMRQRTQLKRRFKYLANMANRRYREDEPLKAFDLWKIAKKQKLRCALTGDKLTNENISVDHIVPCSKGGSNNPSNLRLVRKDVNLALHVLTDEQFFEICKKVVNYNGL